LGLLRLLGSLRGLALAIAGVDGVNALSQQFARLVGQIPRAGDALAGLRGIASVRWPHAHLPALAGRRGESQHPGRRLAAQSQHQTATIRVIPIDRGLYFAHCQQVQLLRQAGHCKPPVIHNRSTVLSASLSANCGRLRHAR
jgi:hypothetical protein